MLGGPPEGLRRTVGFIRPPAICLPAHAAFARTLKDPTLGYVSRYALGRDYHKLLRNRLKSWGRRFRNSVLRSILDLLSIPR
ncbi:DUF1730 domain-containing protein, partial [Mycobacterium tuberculosis]|nr:DUF1730 domain-containing protein [Mycobacterium tuberculosis]